MLDLYAMPLIDLIILAVAILTVLYIIKIYNNRNSYKSNKNQILFVTANLKCPAVDGVKCPKIDERAGQVTPS